MISGKVVEEHIEQRIIVRQRVVFTFRSATSARETKTTGSRRFRIRYRAYTRDPDDVVHAAATFGYAFHVVWESVWSLVV